MKKEKAMAMDAENLFRHIRDLIARKEFDALSTLHIVKPEKFNWVKEVFENIHVRDCPDKPALTWTDGKQLKQFSFREMSAGCNRLLNFLREKGIQQHSVIFSQMPLLQENWLTILACIKGGYRLVPAATNLSVNDIVYRFDTLMPVLSVADAENAQKIDEAETMTGRPVNLKIIINGTRKGWVSFEEIAGEEDTAIAASTNSDDPLFLFFTSGTTGMPKVVIQTQWSYPYGHLSTASWIGIRQDDVHYNISQPGWAKFAYSSFFSPWNAGATIFAYYQPGRFNAADQLAIMEKFRITTFCAPPTALRMLILEDLASYKFSLRECVSAGEPLNPEVIGIWKQGTGIIIRDGFGQTETTILIGNLPGSPIRYGSMGKPTFMYRIVIADDDGKEMNSFEEGNITVRTNTGKTNGLLTGYSGNPGKMKEVFKHGLYYTGDKAYKDDDGYVWFVGRDDDVIKTSDYRVGPFEIESVLLEHAAVVESAVVGSPHAVKGAVIKAFIVLRAGCIPDRKMADEIFAFANKTLAAYKSTRIIEFVTELPKTISGKIRRIELRADEAQRKSRQLAGEHEYYIL